MAVQITQQVSSIAVIEANARLAATKYSNVNEACPYPFGTVSAFIFCNAFNAAKAATTSTPEATPCQK